MAYWDQLLPDILTMIVKKVDIYEDFIAFGGVCTSWRSVAVKENFNQQLVSSSSSPYSVQPPWLMLAEKETKPDLREFVNLSKGGMSKKIALPEAKGKWCSGSMGWLITIGVRGMELLHPLNRSRIPLPHLITFKHKDQTEDHGVSPMSFVYRATLSASPSATDDYAVMLTLGLPAKLAFWKPGNKRWTFVETSCNMYEVTYHKDKFYATNSANEIVVCDVRGPDPKAEIVGALPPHFATAFGGQVYLTECCGDLLAVLRILSDPDDDDDEDSYRTTAFSIWKRADPTSFSKWREVNDLGGASIFVGQNTAICVPSAVAVGVKPNCVYFTDDYVSGYAFADGIIGGKDMGIYNLATREIEPLYRGTSLSRYCPPIWVSPSF